MKANWGQHLLKTVQPPIQKKFDTCKIKIHNVQLFSFSTNVGKGTYSIVDEPAFTGYYFVVQSEASSVSSFSSSESSGC